MQVLAVALGLILAAGLLKIASSPYVACAFGVTLVIHLTTQPERRTIMAVVALGALFSLVYWLSKGTWTPYFGWYVGTPAGFLGMGSFIVLAYQWLTTSGAAKATAWEDLRDAAFLPILCIGSLFGVGLATTWTPLTYDRLIYAFDDKFGGPPSWVIGRAFRLHPFLYSLCGHVYNSLPLGLGLGLAMQRIDARKQVFPQVDLRWAAAALGIVGYIMYQICPAAGPIYLFERQFPFEIPKLAGLALVPAALEPVARNAMPSLHVGWALLLYWNIRRRSLLLSVAGVLYLFLTALATLGSGEHYLADLIVAPPLVLAVQAACSKISSFQRWAALAIGGALTLGWLVAFRTGAALSIPAGLATWMLVAVSLLITGVLAWRLDNASWLSACAIAGITDSPAPDTAPQ